MAATITVVQNSGWAYSTYVKEVGKSIFYFITIDDASGAKATYPVSIPVAGTNYSYEVWLRCRCDVAPAVSCSNFKAWYDSGMPSNQVITVNTDAIAAYAQPVITESAQGTRADFTTKNSGSKIDVAGTLDDINDYTDWLVFQLEVQDDAISGSETVNWYISYDEI